MRRILLRVNFALRRAVCFVIGHVKRDVSITTVGVKICRRCLQPTPSPWLDIGLAPLRPSLGAGPALGLLRAGRSAGSSWRPPSEPRVAVAATHQPSLWLAHLE
jgi:hypothetical protein